MFSPEKESVSTGNQEDVSEQVEFEIPTDVPQGRDTLPDSKEVIQSRDITFNETVMFLLGKESVSTGNQEDVSEKVEFESPVDVPQGGDTLPHSHSEVYSEEVNPNIPSPKPQATDTYSLGHDRPRRTITKPARSLADDENGLIAYALAIAQETPKGIEPSSYSKAISCPNSSNQLIAIQEETESPYKNETWKLCDLQKGRRALTSKWIYKRKEDIPSIEDARWNARQVVQGCNQKEGIDFNEVFSPVVRHTYIRVLLAFITLFDLELEQLDVKTAFLHSVLKEEIHMKQPEGFVVSTRNPVCVD